MKAFLLLVAFILCQLGAMSAHASAIPNHPGWKLEKIEKTEKNAEEPATDGVAFEYAEFFALYPNDSRPPITVDGGTATRLLNGQANPETIYFNRMAGGAELAKQQSQGGSGGGVGWQVAEATYVPMGEDKGRAPSSISNVAGLSRSGSSSAPASSSGGASSYSPGAGSSGASAGAGIADANSSSTLSVGSSGGAGAGNFTSGNTYKPSAASANNSGAANSSGEPGNLTYSQMIDQAMGNASTSLCGRMGSYAGAGQCGK